MKILLNVLVVLALVFFSMVTQVDAAYRLELENGGVLVVGGYWEEDGMIKFYRYGGLVGVPKTVVVAINQYEGSVSGATSGRRVGAKREGELPQEVEEWKERLRQNRYEIGKQIGVYQQAVDKGDQNLVDQSLMQIRALRENQDELRHEVSAHYRGDLPDWWRTIGNE